VTRAEDSAEKNRVLLGLEREVANEQRAVNAQIEKQRQELESYLNEMNVG